MELWERIQLQYAEYLKDEPALGGVKITTSIYDPILIFAWNAVIPHKPPLEDVQPIMCNCDHMAMQKLHATLIREGTCVESNCCDYCIVGDRNPLAAGYQLIKKENGLLVSVPTEH